MVTKENRLEKIKEANELYASGLSCRMVAKAIKIGECTMFDWIRKGLIPRRSHADSVKIASEQGRMRGALDWNEEQKNKARERMVARIIKDPMNHPNRRLANNRVKMSRPERMVYDLLNLKDIKFFHSSEICGYFPDFLIDKTIIEVDGERWHDKEKDAKRDKILSDAGYKVFRFPAKQVMKNPSIVLSCL